MKQFSTIKANSDNWLIFIVLAVSSTSVFASIFRISQQNQKRERHQIMTPLSRQSALQRRMATELKPLGFTVISTALSAKQSVNLTRIGA
jgi:hypothetical protein